MLYTKCDVGPCSSAGFVFSESVQLEPTLSTIADGISLLLPQATHQDIWPMRLADEMLQAVRGADCRIFESSTAGGAAAYGQPRSTKKWWQFW
jgi:hypothetical protein